MFAFEIGEEEAGKRLDIFVSSLTGASRAQARRWIESGAVAVDGRRVLKPARSAPLGALVEVTPPEPLSAAAEPEAIPLAVLFEDEQLIVVDKPAGMVVHPAPGHASGTLVNALLHHCRGQLAGVGGVARPGIVHRLDRGTSGVMVAAKTDAAHRALAAEFHDHTIERVYRALVRALPSANSGCIDRAIGRHPRDRKRMSVRTNSGRAARTNWRNVRPFPTSERSWLEVRPETGRTHQIRVHLASAGMPIAGDPVYGGAGRTRGPGAACGAERALARPALHAAVLGFQHPLRGERMRFEAALPPDLQTLLDELVRREAAR